MKAFLRLESAVREQLENLALRVCVAVRLRTPWMGVHNPARLTLMDVGKEVGRCEEERKQQQRQRARKFHQFSQNGGKGRKICLKKLMELRKKSAFESGHYIRRGTVGKEFALHEIHRGSDVVEESVIALAQIVQPGLPV